MPKLTDGLALIAQGFSMLAEAVPAAATTAPERWLDPGASPLGRRRALGLARSGAIASSKVGKRIMLERASHDAYIERHVRPSSEPSTTADEDLFG